MHGVFPHRPPPPDRASWLRAHFPLIGFAAMPFAALAISTVLQGRGSPSLAALTQVLTTIGEMPNPF